MNTYYDVRVEAKNNNGTIIHNNYMTNDIEYAMNYVRDYIQHLVKCCNVEAKNITWEIEEMDLM